MIGRLNHIAIAVPDLDKASALYREVLTKEPKNVIALNNLAYLLALQGNDGLASELIGIAIETAGPITSLLDTRAKIHFKGGRTEQAVDDLKQAISQSPVAFRKRSIAGRVSTRSIA